MTDVGGHVEPGVDGVAEKAIGSVARTNVREAFSWPAFFFPIVWTFVYGLVGLSALAFVVWLADVAVLAAVVLMPDLARAETMSGKLMAVALTISVARLGIALYAGFRGNRLYWRRFPTRMVPADFRARQTKWVQAGLLLLVLSVGVAGLDPVWVTSQTKLGGQFNFYGITITPPQSGFMIGPRVFSGSDPKTIPDPRSRAALVPGVYHAIPVIQFDSTPQWPETWVVVRANDPSTATGKGVQYRVSPTLWTEYSLNGTTSNHGDFRDALDTYSGSVKDRARLRKVPRLDIAVTRPGEIAEINAEFVTVR